MHDFTPIIVALLTTGVTAAVSVPVVGWIAKTKERRVIAFTLAGVIALAVGVLVYRTLSRNVAGAPVATEGGSATPGGSTGP